MLSSGPGVRASGASSSLNSQNSNAQHEATHSPQQLGAGPLGTHPDLPGNDNTNGRGTGPSSPGFSPPFDSNNWFNYTVQTLLQHPSSGPSVSPPMIGPTSTLYDPDLSLQQPDAGQAYQQWINQYNDQQQYGRDMIHYTDHLQNYSTFTYPESITDTVTPPTVNQYQQQNILYDSYRSELLIATGLITSANTTLSSTLDTQAYQRSTPDSTLTSYTSPPNSQVLPTDHHLSPQLAHNSILQRDQPVSRRANQQHFLAGFKAQFQGTTVPQIQENTNVPSHEHPLPSPSSSSQPYREGQNALSANQHPSPVQQSSQEPGNNLREFNLRKQLQESSSPYTTNQLNIQGPTPSSRLVQAYGNERTSPGANACGSGREILFGGSQATQCPSKLGASKGSPKHPNAASRDPFIPVKSTSKRRKRDHEGNFVNAGGDTEGESDGEEADGFTGGIEIGLGGLGVENVDGKVEKGGQRPPGACKHCKKLKMKCDFPMNDNTCKRCKAGGHVCIVEGRKPRTAPNKREYLLAQIRQKDAIIESLLKQLHNPYLATPLSVASYRMATSPSDQNKRNVLSWLDRLQSSVRDAGSSAGPDIFIELQNREEAESDCASDTPNIEFADEELEGDDDNSETEKLQNTLPDAHVPLGLIAKLSIDNSHIKGKKDRARNVNITDDEDLNDDNVGVANETYFMPGPAFDLNRRAMLIEQHSPPEILVHGLVNPDDVQKLFNIFYQYVNPFISVLDPVLHTPASTFARCPFLFTVVCAISSRYYVGKSEIYPIAMHFAKHSAANALIDGWKSVELCQAYILMSIYAVPARRWEEDRSWLYTGLAIRIATDLNLHHVSSSKSKHEKDEREALNRARVWMICFNLDRSTATQFGKPSTIKEDYIIRNARDWYKKSLYNVSHDIHLCAYSALLQIVAKFHDEIFSDPSTPSGLNKNVDFRQITMKHDEYLTQYHEEWLARFEESSDPNDPSCVFRCSLLPFLVGYSRLVMFSFGFQQAFQRGIGRNDQVFFTKCLEAAKSVVRNMVDRLAPSGYMRYAPDGHFVFASFASAFLLKLLRPEFASLLSKEQESNIFELIGRLIQTLSSPKIAIDDRHTPKLYARFLAGLLSRHRRDGANMGRFHCIEQHKNAGNKIPSSTMTTFSVAPQPQNSVQSSRDLEYTSNDIQPQQSLQTMIYESEANHNMDVGPIHCDSDMELALIDTNYSSDEEMLATMQVIKNPSWWQNMMMPGFSWTPDPSPSPPQVMGHQAPQPPPSFHSAIQHPDMASSHAMHPGFNAYQAVQVSMR